MARGRQDSRGPRKLSWADVPGLEVDTARAAAVGSSSASLSSSTTRPNALPFPLTYVVTPREARALRRTLARLGLASASVSSSASSTAPPTPTHQSYPSTPGGGLPPKSPFIPMSAIKSATGGSTSSSSFGHAVSTASTDTGGAGGSSGSSTRASGITAFTSASPPSSKPPQPTVARALGTVLDDDVLPATSRAALRSMAAGFSIHAVLNVLVPALFRRKSPGEAARLLVSAGAARIALALGFFNLLYRSINYLLTFLRLKSLASLPDTSSISLATASHRARALARLVQVVRGNGLVPFFSALLASPALVLLPAQSAPGQASKAAVSFPRKTLALDFFTKGLHAHFDVLKRRRSALVTWIPDWCDAALLYAIGQGQLLWAFLFEPDCFPSSYGDFILARSSAYVPSRPQGLPNGIAWPSRRQLADHVALLSTPSASFKPYPSFTSPSLSALTPSSQPTTPYTAINPVLDWSPAHPAHARLMCALLHPTEPSCRTNYLNFWAQEWKQTAKFVAVFTALFNVFRWRAWKKDPEGSLFRFALNVAQGATVISGNIATAWGLTCLFQEYLPSNFLPRARYFFNGFFSSIFIYAVPAARRVQLSLYVARLSMDSTWQTLAKRRKVPSSRNGDVALLAVGFAMLAALYEDTPFALSGYLRRVLRIAVGPRITGTAASTPGLPPSSEPAAPGAGADFGAQLRARFSDNGRQR